MRDTPSMNKNSQQNREMDVVSLAKVVFRYPEGESYGTDPDG